MSEDGKQRFLKSGKPRPKRQARLNPRYQKLLDGDLTLDDLDEEELFRGQLRGADGSFRGAPPAVIPWMMHAEAMAAVGKRVERIGANNIEDILASMVRIATGDSIFADARAQVDAQKYLLDRLMGKPVERQVTETTITAKWEQAFEDGGGLLVDVDPDIVQ